MTKGKPWPVEDEKKLKKWVESGVTDLAVLSFSFDGRYSRNAVYQKMLDLGIASKEEEACKHNSSSSIALTLPDELPSVEEQLKVLAASLKALQTPNLDRTEVMRLSNIIRGVEVYIARFAEYVNYRRLEVELAEWKARYAALAQKIESAKSKRTSTPPNRATAHSSVRGGFTAEILAFLLYSRNFTVSNLLSRNAAAPNK